MSWTVPAEWDGQRADKVLARLAGCSRSTARAALDTGTVTLDGAAVEARHRVVAGAVLEGEIPSTEATLLPEKIEFGVPYEDDHLAVVDKPAGVVTHPGAGVEAGTLAGGLLHRWPRIRGVGQEGRWGIVHRLDRDTSGLLVVALTTEAYDGLVAAMKRRAIEREYLALVRGGPEMRSGTIDAPIGRDASRPTRMAVDRSGRRAVTHYRVEQEYGEHCLLRVALETGRTHQIRVHLSSIGLPIVGDRVYGRDASIDRVFLHAARLALDHPLSDAAIDIASPLPAGLRRVLAGLE